MSPSHGPGKPPNEELLPGPFRPKVSQQTLLLTLHETFKAAPQKPPPLRLSLKLYSPESLGTPKP